MASARRLTLPTPSGTVTASYTYDAFGALRSGTQGTNPFLFAGEQRDPESGYSYHRARYYDPATGRFISKDPLGTGYKYAGNNPVNFTDPSGLLSPGDFESYADYWTAYMGEQLDASGVADEDPYYYANAAGSISAYFEARDAGWGGPDSGIPLSEFVRAPKEYGYNPGGHLQVWLETEDDGTVYAYARHIDHGGYPGGQPPLGKVTVSAEVRILKWTGQAFRVGTAQFKECLTTCTAEGYAEIADLYLWYLEKGDKIVAYGTVDCKQCDFGARRGEPYGEYGDHDTNPFP